MEPRKETLLREPTPSDWRKAAWTRRKWPGVEIPSGSKSRACTHGGSPETWEVLSPPPNPGDWEPGDQFPRQIGGTSKQAKASAGGRAKGSRSACIVPSKRGNSSWEDAVEGRRASDHGTVGEKDEGNVES
jgi:hypothetical protein